MSAKFGVLKNVAAPNMRLLPCPLKRRAVFRPSVPGTSDVLSSNVRKAVFTFAGMSGRETAVVMDSIGFAMFIASRKSSVVAEAKTLRSALKHVLPTAALVPLSKRNLRTTSPRTAMISGVLKRRC